MRKILKNLDSNNSGDNGFTIIELLISIGVFGMVLVVLTLSVLGIGRFYDKGIVQAQTQNAERNITDEIGQAIEFSGTTTPAPSLSFSTIYGFPVGQLSAGSNCYVFVEGFIQTGSNSSFRSLPQPCNSTSEANVLNNGRELLSPHMRVASLTLSPLAANPNLFRLTVKIVYGSQSVVCDSSVAGDCSLVGDSTKTYGPTLTCKNETGTEFCAESDSTTVVDWRS